jgi:hypothetical protein
MLSDNLLVALAQSMLELRRSLDVGEEKRDGAVREFCHRAILTRTHGDDNVPYRY